MLQIVDLTNTTHQVNNIKQITRSRKINGETSIDFEAWPDPKYPDAWRAVDNESKLMFMNEPFIIKDVTRGNVGETEAKKLSAEHTFFNNMINAQQYAIHSGSQTFQAALTRVFAPTQYNFVIVDSFTAQAFDNFGRENCLALFQKVLERYGAEFRVSGNTVYLYKQIGAHTGFQWRYKHNIKSITEEKSTRSLTTVIKGYFGKPDDNGIYPMEIEHRSTPEKIAKFGELHAESYTNENVTDETTALRLLDERLNDEPLLSQTIDFADLQAAGYDQGRPNEGDWGYIIYEPMDIRVEARIVEVNEVFQLINNEWTPIKTTVTLSNIRQTQTDKNTRFAKTSKQVDRLASGVDSMPLSSMDIAVRNMTRLMQNASTELQFPESGGMLAVSKLDSNKMVIYNSEGIFFSADGGATPYAGMTGDGIVADAINVGTLRGILIDGVEIFGSRFYSEQDELNYTLIEGPLVESRGRFTRTFRGVETTHDIKTKLEHGYVRFRNDSLTRSLYMSEFGISTFLDGTGEYLELPGGSSGSLIFWDGRYSPSNANGVTLNSYGGVVALESDLNRIVLDAELSVNLESRQSPVFIKPYSVGRPGNNTFNFTVLDGESATDTDGFTMYGSDVNGYGVGLRWSKRASEPVLSVVDTNFERGGDTTFDVGNVRTNDIRKRLSDVTVYWNGSGTGTTGGANANSENTLRASGIRPRDGDTWLYLATDQGGAVAVTDAFGYNEGNGITYRDINARAFNVASSRDYKKNIEDYSGDATAIIKNSVVRHYNMLDDVDGLDLKRIGLIVEEAPLEVINLATGDSLDIAAAVWLLWKSNQELAEKIEELESA